MRLTVILLGLFLPAVYAVDHHQAIPLTETEIRALGIETAPIKVSSESFSPSYPAQVVVPNAQIRVVGANVAGLISRIDVATGEEITSGQNLCTISSPELLSQQQNFLQTIIELNLARLNLNRDKQLNEEGIIPKRRYQEALTRWKILNSQKQQLHAVLLYSGMTSAQIEQLEKNQALNSDITITAPMNGVLLEQIATAGQKVEATDPLFKIADLSSLWLEVHVPLGVTEALKRGDTVFVPEFGIEATIITIGKQIHRADQGTFIRAEVLEKTESLRPGQFVQARFSQNKPDGNKYAVPAKAIVRINEQTFVFVAMPNGFTPIDIQMSGYIDDQQIISTAQKIADPIVVKGASSLKAMLLSDDGE